MYKRPFDFNLYRRIVIVLLHWLLGGEMVEMGGGMKQISGRIGYSPFNDFQILFWQMLQCRGTSSKLRIGVFRRHYDEGLFTHSFQLIDNKFQRAIMYKLISKVGNIRSILTKGWARAKANQNIALGLALLIFGQGHRHLFHHKSKTSNIRDLPFQRTYNSRERFTFPCTVERNYGQNL